MTLNRLSLAAATLLGLGLPLATAFAQGQAPAQAPVAATKGATVNGVAIPPSRIDTIVKAQAARGVPDTPQLRDEVREQLIVREIIAQEATRKGLPKNADVQVQLDLARQQVLWNAYVADFVRTHPVADPQVRAEYDKLKASRGDKEYKTRHILLEKEDEAKAVIADLKKGRKFEELAKQSKDTGSQGPRRRPRLELARRLREAVRRRDGEARQGQVHRDAGADAVRLARHPGRGHPAGEVPVVRRGQAADHRGAAEAGLRAQRRRSAREGEGRVAVPGVSERRTGAAAPVLFPAISPRRERSTDPGSRVAEEPQPRALVTGRLRVP